MIEKYLPRTEFDSYEDFKQNYRINVPERFNFGFDVVDEWARLQPDKLALVWIDDDFHEKRLTFTDLSQLSNRAANLFVRCGIGKGDYVLLMLKQRIEAWVCILALHKLGAVVIPASFQLTEKDIVYRCNAANVKMVVGTDDPDIVRHLNLARADCPTVGTFAMVSDHPFESYLDFRTEMRSMSAEFARDPSLRTSDPMLVFFSSGTTGMPKMVLHDQSWALGHITTAKYWQQVEEDGLHLTVSDSGWAKFGWGKIYGQWICGAVVVGYDTEKFNPKRLLEIMQYLKLTSFCAPPTIYRFLIKEDLKAYDLSSIKHCGIAGEPLNPEVFYQFKEATGLEVKEGFGQSETTVIIANYPWFPVKPGSTGKPSPLYDLDIVDEEGNSCEDGIVGTIVVRNTDKVRPCGLFREYHNAEEVNARAFANNMYSTGDQAWRDSEGYYWFVGRNDDVIKCSGYRIGPFEVESALISHPAVLECAVTAVPDPVRGQVVKATVVLAKGFTPSDELKKELQNHVKKVTAPYKYPRVVEFVSELPKTSSGKIRRVEIRANDLKKYQS